MAEERKGSYRVVPKADTLPSLMPANKEDNKDDDAICLKPKMGLLNGVTVIVGSIIGSGIFVSPKGVLLGTGSVGLSLVVWIASGVFSMIGAFCYAELGCMITKSGADYAYIMESFGPFVAFIRLWVECMIVRPCSQAVVALTFSFYVLRPMFPDCDPPDASVRFLAVLCILILTFVNCWDVKWSMTVQNVFTFGKLFALAIIILTGVYMLCIDLSFSRRSNVTEYSHVHTGVKPLSCSICNNSFSHRSDRTKHYLVQMGAKPFFCNICHKSFSKRSHLTDHSRVHTGEKPFSCNICNKSFSRKSILTVHNSVHTGEKPFFCSICNTSFSRRSHLARHSHVHTEEKPYSCSICNISFSRRSVLTRHSRVHTEEKPYSCSICNKSFSQRIDLSRHNSVHTGEKPFSCSICNMSFSQRGHLTIHYRIHTDFWNYLNFVIEELIEPHKNLPRAIFISCILVTVVYTMTVVAFHTTLSVAEVLGAEAVAVTFADSMYGKMAWIMPVFVAMSTYGGVNGILFTSSRLFYAGAEYGQMPRILAMIQVKHLTPAPAVIAMALLSILYLCSSDIYALINYVGFATWLAIGLAVVCLPYLRWKQPNLPRPIKVHLIFPIIYIIATIFITVVPMMADPVGTGFGALIIATGVPVYLIFIYWENKPKAIRNAINSTYCTLQKLLVVVPAEKSS
nr:large neutral amino acids transporter small subunit 2 [Parasteatoda tepidariorum]